MRLPAALALVLMLAFAGCFKAEPTPLPLTGTPGPAPTPLPSPPTGSGVTGALPEKVAFITTDGWRIVGSWFAPEGNETNATLILLHEYTANRHGWDGFAAILAARGYGVLSFDLRGHGESNLHKGVAEGIDSFGPSDLNNMTLDLRAARGYAEAVKHRDPAKFAYLGASIGANVAIVHAANDTRLKAVVALSPAVHPPALDPEPVTPFMKAFFVGVYDPVKDPEATNATAILVKEITDAGGNAGAIEVKDKGHGTQLLRQSDLPGKLIAFLRAHVLG